MRYPLLLILGFFLAFSNPQTKTAEGILFSIPQIDSLKRIEGDTLFLETWELWFSQPVDHNNNNGPRFPQRVIYNHKGFDKPMVVAIEGYNIFSIRAEEPTKLLDANQINIEHRFFERSRPKDSIPWKYLDIFQSATDIHMVIQAFKSHYPNKWVSTGISKGGQATIFHRYFYPSDVDVSIPYVAPLNFSNEDERVYSFLQNVGTPECRERIERIQKELFKRKERLMPLAKDYTNNNNYTFEFGLNRAYNLNVLEYSFAFWQWSGLTCEEIPSPNVDDLELFKHWVTVTSFDFFEDNSIDEVRPFFYQAMTEIGMYGYEVTPWQDFLPDTTNITFDFTMPKGHRAIFNPVPMQKVNEWIQTEGNYMLYIYGEYDPWSAPAVVPSPLTKSAIFFNPAGDHTTRIHSFPETTRDSIYTVLQNWLGITISK